VTIPTTAAARRLVMLILILLGWLLERTTRPSEHAFRHATNDQRTCPTAVAVQRLQSRAPAAEGVDCNLALKRPRARLDDGRSTPTCLIVRLVLRPGATFTTP
ncbi:MAG: hypothetical protein QOI06_2252, partial [Nocardioidaceae bacterium]|nr:hypothetical protein [Nocardioidaceae bacterium]